MSAAVPARKRPPGDGAGPLTLGSGFQNGRSEVLLAVSRSEASVAASGRTGSHLSRGGRRAQSVPARGWTSVPHGPAGPSQWALQDSAHPPLPAWLLLMSQTGVSLVARNRSLDPAYAEGRGGWCVKNVGERGVRSGGGCWAAEWTRARLLLGRCGGDGRPAPCASRRGGKRETCCVSADRDVDTNK